LLSKWEGAMPPALLCLSIFNIWSHTICPDWPQMVNHLVSAFHVAGIKEYGTMPALLVEMEILLIFCLGFP
jgi:hypothetical protein